jgi:orotate phosphoribosyltransferase-like protein
MFVRLATWSSTSRIFSCMEEKAFVIVDDYVTSIRNPST